jgi:hypothetical protein
MKIHLGAKLQRGLAPTAISSLDLNIGHSVFRSSTASNNRASGQLFIARISGGVISLHAQALDLENLLGLNLKTDGSKTISINLVVVARSSAGQSIVLFGGADQNTVVTYRVRRGTAAARKFFFPLLSRTSSEPTPERIVVSPAVAIVGPGQTQQFNAAVLDQNGNSIFAFVDWGVAGGGSIDSTGLFTAGLTSGGPFTVSAGSFGVSGTASVSIQRSSLSQISIDSPATVTVNGASASFSVAARGNAVTFSWDFGDGSTATGSAVSHTYFFPGTYVAFVTVTDASGNSIISTVQAAINTTSNGIFTPTSP